VLLDAGGVIVLPDRRLVQAALASVGVTVDPAAVAPAHYAAVRQLDQQAATAPVSSEITLSYFSALCRALNIVSEREEAALTALRHLADRSRSRQILWSEPAPRALRTLAVLHRRGVAVVIVTNSDGHAAENLRDAGICAVGPGAAAEVTAIIDSVPAGAAKPDPRIFAAALAQAKARPQEAVHVGDMLSSDIAGAQAAGITAIHLDPYRRCRRTDHRHLRVLSGMWRHIEV
jgi:putative hydrolase of the HAD superfamily